MSEFHIKVVRVGPVEKHPNADTLGVTRVFDYPVIVRLSETLEGSLAVYVPVDSLVPADDPRWAFLDGHNHIKAKKLRGVFSMGLLTPADPSWVEGQDVREALRITKYEPPEPMSTGGEDEANPGFMPDYTDVEGLRRWPDVLQVGEEVVLTEKLHGANGRWIFQDGRLWCASHHNWKKDAPDIIWWKAARQYKLDEILAKRPDLGFYGEVYGGVQDLRYGTQKGTLLLAMFDTLEIKTKRYLNYDEHVATCKELGLPLVPELYRGPWKPELRALAEGPSTVPGAGHVREGFVARPLVERWSDQIGRVVLKLHGEGYLTRKGSK